MLPPELLEFLNRFLNRKKAVESITRKTVKIYTYYYVILKNIFFDFAPKTHFYKT